VSETSDLIPLDPDEKSDVADIASADLRGIAERLQVAMEELFAAKSEAEQMNAAESASVSVSDEARGSSTVAPRALTEAANAESTAMDRRLYVPHSQNWQAGIQSGAREYCCIRQPGEDWFHLLVNGEIYLQFGNEKMCLNCAFRQGNITDDRLYWQTRGRTRETAKDQIPMSNESLWPVS
jgi:hypothetical protein